VSSASVCPTWSCLCDLSWSKLMTLAADEFTLCVDAADQRGRAAFLRLVEKTPWFTAGAAGAGHDAIVDAFRGPQVSRLCDFAGSTMLARAFLEAKPSTL
jgi:hypothetical protein